MALGPKDLALTPDEERAAKTAETQIDETLRKNFVPGISSVTIPINVTGRVAIELVRRYNGPRVGWRLVELNPTRTELIFHAP